MKNVVQKNYLSTFNLSQCFLTLLDSVSDSIVCQFLKKIYVFDLDFLSVRKKQNVLKHLDRRKHSPSSSFN